MKNPVGHTTSVTYDLLPTKTDASLSTTNTTLMTSATYGYRLFKPLEFTDTNGEAHVPGDLAEPH
ncbi:hypothetical protein FIV42_15980 [Persicimonas caeni]|uniref:Uncharacterized protein n=1 Tax=Persicimonas caeni TaxID=2292766 RepID=A0A4Y6PV03_PERCE|nr:hypothetical protein [Persicimonas caeni]QDG52184.1 hypothetical protein FIV42_15980 [Persicimonas caeni]QED33406.1 hypothetical protein FRD00_15975 [Persicimonas caeni]